MPSRRVLSFKYAFDGIWVALKEEPNLKFHFLAAILALLLSWYFSLSLLEWIIIIFTVALVISVELTNTAIETVVDSFTENSHPGAKRAKDVSAGAVLIVSIAALMIGIIIFLPHILTLI